MLEVETNHQIILLYFREGYSLRKIAKQLKVHRDTVKRHIAQYEQFKSAPSSDQDNPKSLLNQYLKAGHVYNSENRVKRKLTVDIVDIIEACLRENQQKRNDGRIKQQFRKIDIHEKVLGAGHSISYPVICAYISGQQAEGREAFIRQGYSPGSSCEFDWGEVKIRLDGKWRRYYLAVFTSAYSNYRYALLFQRQATLAFKEAHICFFEHTGGVFQQFVYDNMRVAIAAFVGRTEKVPTEALLQLSRWYQYQWRFCNTAKGNEKGREEDERLNGSTPEFAASLDFAELLPVFLVNFISSLKTKKMKHQIGPYLVYILAILLLCITAGIIRSWKNEKHAYELRETLPNLAVFAGFQFSKYLFAGYQLAMLGFTGKLSLFKLPHNGWVSRLLWWHTKKANHLIHIS